MKVLIDGVAFENTYRKGIRRYATELLNRVDEDFAINLESPLAGTVPSGWEMIPPPVAKVGRRHLIRRWAASRQSRAREQLLRGFSLYHSIWFRPCPIPGLPTVVTVYDMISEIMPTRYHSDAERDSVAKVSALESADAIIAISDATRMDLKRVLPSIRAPIHVIPLAVSPLESRAETFLPSEASGSAAEPYALYVGDRAGYKNFHTLLEAIVHPDWPSGLGLRVVGSEFSVAEHASIRYFGAEKRLDHAGTLSDERLAKAYTGASVFIFPSLIEGFGLPMLEANSRCVPVVAHDIPVFHEVGSDSFQACDCRDPKSIARAVNRVLEPAVRDGLVESGLRNIKRFSWDEVARKTRAVWASVCE